MAEQIGLVAPRRARSDTQSPPSASITATWVSTTPAWCTEHRWRVWAIAAETVSVRPK